MTTYGVCPKCGVEGVSRERSPDGFTRCANRHAFTSEKWDAHQIAVSGQPMKRRAWSTPHGFVDMQQPVTYEEACKVMAEATAKLWPDKDGPPNA